ncbi:restriction endonuclease subunit S, partial [Flavobacterium sp. LB1P62]|uniref:restriction endonuclease subunit S n=1 Tax=Flavobacterium sp. LB1P62 TaxID=3401715 RepID=UPI003AAD1FB9
QTQNKIIEGLKLSKQTLIKKIFSKELRFKNDDEINYPDWQIKKLGEITLPVSKRNKSNEKLPVYSINNRLGFVPQNEQFEGINSDDRGYDITLYKVIDKYTFAYNPARINVGSIGYSRDLENIIISSLYVCFVTNEYVDDNFLFQYLKTEKFNKEVLKNVEGGVRDYLFYENFARIIFEMPCIEEQNKIADFLCTLDNKIDMETNYLKKLEEQKKYLLQNMFV